MNVSISCCSPGQQSGLPANTIDIGHVDRFGSVVVFQGTRDPGRGGLLANRPRRAKVATAKIDTATAGEAHMDWNKLLDARQARPRSAGR